MSKLTDDIKVDPKTIEALPTLISTGEALSVIQRLLSDEDKLELFRTGNFSEQEKEEILKAILIDYRRKRNSSDKEKIKCLKGTNMEPDSTGK